MGIGYYGPAGARHLNSGTTDNPCQHGRTLVNARKTSSLLGTTNSSRKQGHLVTAISLFHVQPGGSDIPYDYVPSGKWLRHYLRSFRPCV